MFSTQLEMSEKAWFMLVDGMSKDLLASTGMHLPGNCIKTFGEIHLIVRFTNCSVIVVVFLDYFGLTWSLSICINFEGFAETKTLQCKRGLTSTKKKL